MLLFTSLLVFQRCKIKYKTKTNKLNSSSYFQVKFIITFTGVSLSHTKYSWAHDSHTQGG